MQRLACQPHSRLPQPLPLLELPLPPARSTQLGRIHCQRRCHSHFRHWCGQQGEGGGLSCSSCALLICPMPTRRAAQRACAARAAQSSHARARANVGSSPGQRHEAHTSWPAHTEAEEEGSVEEQSPPPTVSSVWVVAVSGARPVWTVVSAARRVWLRRALLVARVSNDFPSGS